MTVKRLSTSGSSVTPSTIYPDLLAGYGDFGALQRIGYGIVTGATGTFSFLNIPQTYQHLYLVISAKQSGSTYNSRLRFNGDTGNNYSASYLYGNGTTAASNRLTNQSGFLMPDLTSTTSQSQNILLYNIFNYTDTTINKTSVLRFVAPNRGTPYTWAEIDKWSSNSAITSLTFDTTGSEAFNTGSTATLYGLKASAS